MATNIQKTPIGLSLNRFAKGKVLDQIQQTGRALPCQVVKVSGAIVQVAFQVQAAPGETAITLPNVTIPIIGFEYARPPVQIGCKGLAVAADAYLGGMSGLGGGAATTTQMANLTTLAFAPVGNKGWTVVDPNAYVIYGPNGVVLRDEGSHCVFTLTPTGISITIPSGHDMAVTIAGGGSLNITGGTVNVSGGDVTADGISLKTHVHSGVQTGGGDTGPPV